MDPISNACDELFDLCGGKIYLGFSGGMDSMVLLHAVVATARRRDALWRVVAVHVDHGLDSESAAWASACAARVAGLGVSFETEALRLSSGSNLEARARTARYAVFEQLLGVQDLLVLAHHHADQTESLLLHLLQGRGLYGMPRTRALGAGRVVRPLLYIARDELAGYGRLHDLTWIEDPSNRDVSLDRNFLRHEVLPPLLARFPELPKRLSQLGEATAATGQALVELAGLDRQPLPLSVLDGLTQPARLSLLRQWLIYHRAAAGVSHAALAEFLRQLDAANDRQPDLRTAAGRLARYRRQLYLVGESPVLDDDYALKVPGSLALPHGVLDAADHLPESAAPADLPVMSVMLGGPVRISFLPVVSGVRQSAVIMIGGRNRRPRELMREAGIPPWERDTWPLLLDGRGLAAVVGLAVRDPIEALEGRSGSNNPIVKMDVRWTPDVR